MSQVAPSGQAMPQGPFGSNRDVAAMKNVDLLSQHHCSEPHRPSQAGSEPHMVVSARVT